MFFPWVLFIILFWKFKKCEEIKSCSVLVEFILGSLLYKCLFWKSRRLFYLQIYQNFACRGHLVYFVRKITKNVSLKETIFCEYIIFMLKIYNIVHICPGSLFFVIHIATLRVAIYITKNKNPLVCQDLFFLSWIAVM